jgi:hypothetical protein
VKINGEMHYLWPAVDHEGEVLESFASKTIDKARRSNSSSKRRGVVCFRKVILPLHFGWLLGLGRPCPDSRSCVRTTDVKKMV